MKLNNQHNVSPITSAVDVLRADIDRIDDQILDLLEQRYPLVDRVARAKNIEDEQALALRPGRERQIVERLSARASRVPASDIRQIWRSILSLSALHQRAYRVLLWGPETARLALSTLAASRYGGAVEAVWATSAAEARAEALRGDAILMITADQSGWVDEGGLDLIGRYPTGCEDHPWVVELGRLGLKEHGRPQEAEEGSPASASWHARVPASGVVAYLGGRGSFSEEACQRFLPSHELLPLGDVESVVRAVCEGSADLAVVPVANSLAGTIERHRQLLAHPELRVIAEEALTVRQHLLGVAGADVGSIRRLSSHPAALAQCKAYLEQWPWDRLEAASTAQAASEVAAAADPTWAAIGSAAAAQIHGLTVLAHDLQGNARNETRFVIVERRDQFA